MKRTTIAAVAAVLLFTLTGCAESAGNASDERVAPAAEQSAEPLVAETPTEEPSASDKSEAEAAFLSAFRDIQQTYATVIPDATDEQLLASGYEACERLAAGEVSTDISLIEGEERNAQSEMYLDSVSIIGAAVPHLCS